MNANSVNSLALYYAHRLHQANPQSSWQTNVYIAWRIVRFRQLLRQQALRFRYQKTDGTSRLAYGTLNPDHIPQEAMPKPKPTPTPTPSTIPYFDLDRKAWRSFRIENLTIKAPIYPCHQVWCISPDAEPVELEKERVIKEK